MSFLERILEPEVMDDAEDAALYDAMDHAAVNARFVDDLVAFRVPAGEMLDLGCGTALIPLEICRRDLSVRIVATDLSPAMLDIARIRLELASRMSQIRLDRVDAKRLPFPEGHFAWVISNSLIHHLDDPEPAFADAVRVVQPGGCLFFRDLCRPASRAELDALVQVHASAEPLRSQQLFADSLHAALRLEEIRDIVQRLGFDPASVQLTSDRHWTWAARKEDVKAS
jgi:ubiquinone/menaquinone biosynthesis C-methylase UbiE